jgi:putative ABC transport system permease protein
VRDTIDTGIDRRYGQIELQDAQVLTAEGAAASVAANLRADPQVAAAETFTRLDATVQGRINGYDTLLTGLPPTTQMHRFTSTGSGGGLPRDGVLLGEGLRVILGVGAGDRVSITNVQRGIRLEQPVVDFVDEPVSPVVYISAEQLGALAPSGVMLKWAPGVDAETKRQAVTAMPGVVGYISTESIEAAVRQAYSLYDVMVLLTLLSAAVMAAALLYSAMSANVSERTGELGTLQAGGMGAHLLGRLVSTENMMLAVIGVPGGLIAGALLAEWFLSTYVTEGYRWHLVMRPATPVYVAMAVLVAGLLAQIPAFRVISRMDLAMNLRERSL